MLGGLGVDLGVGKMRLGGNGRLSSVADLADQYPKPKMLSRLAALRAPQSMLRVAYITPASAANSSTEPISSEKASRLSRT